MKPEHTPTPWEFVPHADLHSQSGIMAPQGSAHKWVMHPDHGWLGSQGDGQANVEFICRAVNQYEALGDVAVAAGELLLAKTHDNAQRLYAALEQLDAIRKAA